MGFTVSCQWYLLNLFFHLDFILFLTLNLEIVTIPAPLPLSKPDIGCCICFFLSTLNLIFFGVFNFRKYNLEQLLLMIYTPIIPYIIVPRL